MDTSAASTCWKLRNRRKWGGQVSFGVGGWAAAKVGTARPRLRLNCKANYTQFHPPQCKARLQGHVIIT